MYLRRAAQGDLQRAQPFLDAARRQFLALGMGGWLRRIAKVESSGIASPAGLDNSMS